MKLRNKLMPLAAGLATIAAVTPFSLTSCASSSKLVDLRDGYNPSIKRAVWENNKATKTDMNDLYMNAVNENPDIFVQDFLWTNAINYLFNRDIQISNCTYTFDRGRFIRSDYSAYDFDKLEANVTNFSVQHVSIPQTSDETVEMNLMSFDSTIKFTENGYRYATVYDPTSYASNEEIQKYTIDCTFTWNIKNIPFVINRTGLTQETLELDLKATNCYAFAAKLIPSDWDISFDLCKDTNELDTDWTKLSLLEQYGYEFNIGFNEIVTQSSANVLDPDQTTSVQNYEVGRNITKIADLDLTKESGPGYLNVGTVKYLSEFHVQSYYLSQIADQNQQIKK